MATKKKSEPIVKQGNANPDTHLVLHSGALVGIIGHVEGGDGTLYRPGSYRCADGEWRRPASEGPVVYTPEEAMRELVIMAGGNVGQEIARPRGNELGKLRVL